MPWPSLVARRASRATRRATDFVNGDLDTAARSPTRWRRWHARSGWTGTRRHGGRAPVRGAARERHVRPRRLGRARRRLASTTSTSWPTSTRARAGPGSTPEPASTTPGCSTAPSARRPGWNWASRGCTSAGSWRSASGAYRRCPRVYRVRLGGSHDLEWALDLGAEIDRAQAEGPSFSLDVGGDERAELAETLEDPEVRYFLVELGGRPVAQCITFPLPSRRGSFAATLHLSAAAVRQAHRGRGVGTALVDAALERARQYGFRLRRDQLARDEPCGRAILDRLRLRADLRAAAPQRSASTSSAPPRSRRPAPGPRGSPGARIAGRRRRASRGTSRSSSGRRPSGRRRRRSR